MDDCRCSFDLFGLGGYLVGDVLLMLMVLLKESAFGEQLLLLLWGLIIISFEFNIAARSDKEI